MLAACYLPRGWPPKYFHLCRSLRLCCGFCVGWSEAERRSRTEQSERNFLQQQKWSERLHSAERKVSCGQFSWEVVKQNPRSGFWQEWSVSETRHSEQPDEVLFFVRKTKTECKGCELPIIQERDDSAEREWAEGGGLFFGVSLNLQKEKP